MRPHEHATEAAVRVGVSRAVFSRCVGMRLTRKHMQIMEEENSESPEIKELRQRLQGMLLHLRRLVKDKQFQYAARDIELLCQSNIEALFEVLGVHGQDAILLRKQCLGKNALMIAHCFISYLAAIPYVPGGFGLGTPTASVAESDSGELGASRAKHVDDDQAKRGATVVSTAAAVHEENDGDQRDCQGEARLLKSRMRSPVVDDESGELGGLGDSEHSATAKRGRPDDDPRDSIEPSTAKAACTNSGTAYASTSVDGDSAPTG